MTTTNWLAAGKVTCPHCHAQPGNPCVGEYGDPLTWAPAHISRMLDAEKPQSGKGPQHDAA
jgi:hypothetical protein